MTMVRLLERSQLVARYQSSWSHVVDGAVRIHVVQGSPGIGKSTLLAELSARIGDGARLVRGVAREDARGLRAAAEAARPHRLDRSLDPLRAADALTRSWARQARKAPIALLLDDLHELDPASLTAIGTALRRYGGQGLLVVAAGRPSDALTQFADGFDLVALAGLPPVDARRLLLESAGRPIDESVVSRLMELAEGNPLALRNLPGALTTQQLAGTDPLPEPMTLLGDLRSLLTRPLTRLSPPARALLEVAMVSIDGEWGVVRDVVGDTRSTATAFGELERDGLLTVREGRLQPFHPLLRDAVRGSVDAARQRTIAGSLAEVRSLPAGQALLYRALAAVGHDSRLARELVDAAEAALRQRAADTAAVLFERAADLAPPGAEGAAVRLRAAEAHAIAGDAARGRARLARLLETESPALSDDQLVTAEMLLAALEAVGGDAARSRDRLESALDRVPAARRASVLGAMSIPLGMLGDVPALLDTTDRALREVPADEGEQGVLRVVRAHAVSAVDEGAGADFLTDVLASLDVRSAVRSDPLFGLHIGRAFGYAERYVEGARLMAAIVAGARRAGARTTLAMAHGALADLRLRSSRLDDALVQLDEAIAISLGAGQRAFAPFWLGMRARIAGYRGEFAAARDDLTLGYEIADDLGVEGARYFLDAHAGVVAATAMDWQQAVECLERARFFEHANGGLTPQVARWAYELVDAYCALGETGAACDLVDDLESFARRPGARRWTRATAELARGLVLLERDPARSVGSAAAAARSLRAADDRLDRVRARMLQLRALHAVGDSESERRPVTAEMQHGLAALRLRPWAHRLDQELQTRGGRGATRGANADALTAAERRVLDEVARGLGNQQVAARLGISAKTVANHLYRIYEKLGVSSRTEATRRHLLGE